MSPILAISQQQREALLALLHHHLPGVTVWAYFRVDLHVWDEVPERFHEIVKSEYLAL